MPKLTWTGKDKVINHHHEVPFRVLEKQYNFTASTENSHDNRIIHGDNLEALKSLLPEFEGKIKCIYIDPPYNTGNEGWVYNDNVNDEKIKRWLGQVVGKEGEDLSRHDKWLCMIYPRLKLLRKLLADDGVIFISIDDNEQANLKLLMDEIFGIGNFVANVIWEKVYSSRMDAKGFSKDVENLVVFSKSDSFNVQKIKFEQNTKQFNLYDENKKSFYRRRQWRKEGSNARREDRPNLFYPILVDDNVEVFPIRPDGSEGCWRGNLSYFNEQKEQGLIEILKDKNGEWQIYAKQLLLDEATKPPSSFWTNEEAGNTHEAAEEIKIIFGKSSFDTPKPTRLIERILQIATDKNSIILDSFAGSGTTAHAVLKLNAEDGGNRKFILIETMDYAETITAERVRRVMNGYGEGAKTVAGLGGSFDFYSIGDVIFDANGNLNESIRVEEIRKYVAFTEKLSLENQIAVDNDISPYLLGMIDETAYFFVYEKDTITNLNLEFLASLKLNSKPNTLVIYADNCLLSKETMQKYNIIFKKIPRDITRF